jgi:endoglucanase Acf2
MLDAAKYGYSINHLPITLINGNIEFVGFVKEEFLLRIKLEAINKEY